MSIASILRSKFSRTKNVISVFAGHDANISFYSESNNSYHTIELERITRKRYFRLHVDNTKDEIIDLLKKCQLIAEDFWGIENDYETLLMGSDGRIKPKFLREVFNFKKLEILGTHHQCHAASAFWQSPYNKATIFSFDGGGDDGHFNIYTADDSGINFIERVQADFGGGYLIFASLIKEVAEKSSHPLALPGKMMGICAYGRPNAELAKILQDYYFDKDFKKLTINAKLPFDSEFNPWDDPLSNFCFEKEVAYDFAATAQLAFEDAFIKILSRYDQSSPICLTGGGALNVLLNQRILTEINENIFVPPNPNDCGLSLGHLLIYKKPREKINVTYNGVPLLDKKNLQTIAKQRNAKKQTPTQTADLLRQGKIIGVVYGDSEIGPRALGHRSILCNPKFPDMKKTLNARVKFREWYRPFAPVCRDIDVDNYFISRSFENMECMSFAPTVRKNWVELLPSITHVDETARLQIVSESGCPQIYALLTEFSKMTDSAVLLNTSFNLKGKPILTTISDALFALDNTDLDGVLIEDYYFEKQILK